MTHTLSTHWYVLGSGPDSEKIKGPFSIQEIKELYQRGEILPTDGVNHTGESKSQTSYQITVMDLIKSLSDDPSYSLFGAIQFAREHRIKYPTPQPHVASPGSSEVGVVSTKQERKSSSSTFLIGIA